MNDAKIKLDLSSVLYDGQRIADNGVSGDFYIHMLVNNMLGGLELRDVEFDNVFVAMRNRLENILICLEMANHQNIPDKVKESVCSDLGATALSIGIDIMRYHLMEARGFRGRTYRNLRAKYVSCHRMRKWI